MRTSLPAVGTHGPLTLRRILTIDGVMSGSIGILLLLAASPLSDPLGFSSGFLRGVGLILVPFAAVVLFTASRPAIPRGWVGAIVGVNLAWVVASVTLLVSGFVDPTGAGVAFVIAQAIVVAIFADLQFLGMRRSG